jgi:hypothetical protein
MGANTSSNEINKWLESPENQKWLSRTANKIYKELKAGIIPPVILGQDSDLTESREETLTIIESELVVFLFDKKHIFEKLIASGDQNFGRYLRTSFKNHCIDKVRSKSQDPRKYLYKRLSDVLRQSKRFYTKAGKNEYTAFSCCPENKRIAPPTLEDIRQIGFPTDIVASLDYHSVNRKAVLLELSEYFWQTVSQMQGSKAIWVSVWSVIEWIGLHVRWNVSDDTEGIQLRQPPKSAAGDDEKTEQETGVDRIPDPRPPPNEVYFNPHIVKKWADCFAGRLNQKEKAVCYFSWALDLGLKEIALKLGYKGASGPQYLLNQMEDKLRKFLRDLDWLNPEDLNEEAFALFLDTLLSLLKKSVSES